jgi:hypothetical protein
VRKAAKPFLWNVQSREAAFAFGVAIMVAKRRGPQKKESKYEDPTIELPPLRLGYDEYQGELKRRLDQERPGQTEGRLSILGERYPQTFGKYGALDTAEKLIGMLEALPSRYPIRVSLWRNSVDAEVVTVSELSLDWLQVFKILKAQCDEFAQVLMADHHHDEVEARESADIVMMGRIESMMEKLSMVMGTNFDLFLSETRRDAVNAYAAVRGGAPAPYNSLVKKLSREYEREFRRRSHQTPGAGRRRTGSQTWLEIWDAIRAWPSDDPPSLGEFAASLPRFAAKVEPTNPVERRRDHQRARSAIKKVLALLKTEGLCPETDWRKLFKGVRSGQYPRFDPFQLRVDVDAGDESH